MRSIFFLVICIGLVSCNRLLHPDNAVFHQQAPSRYLVVLETTKGNILMEVRREWSPNGADRFYALVSNGYYDNSAVFRIRKGVWAQFGIAGDARVARAWRYRAIPDDPRVLSNERGTVDFAFKDPNTRTTQVFINLQDNSSTHDKEPFVPFARVIEGMNAADSLYAEYGEKSGGGIRGGKQDSLFAEGSSYLQRNFPGLDYIRNARIILAP